MADGERSTVHRLDAATIFNDETLDAIRSEMEACSYFFIEGYLMEGGLRALNSITCYCETSEKQLAYGLAAAYLMQPPFFDDFIKVMPTINLLFGNDDEFGVLGQQLGIQSDVRGVVERLFSTYYRDQKGPRLIIATQGALLVIVASHDGVQEFPVVSIRATDSAGAGDAFAGGFMAGWMRQQPIPTCVMAGCHASAAVIQQRGCKWDQDDILHWQ